MSNLPCNVFLPLTVNKNYPVCLKDVESDCFVRVRKRDLEKLEAEVRTLREFMPKVINSDFIETIQKGRSLDACKQKLFIVSVLSYDSKEYALTWKQYGLCTIDIYSIDSAELKLLIQELEFE